MDNFLLGAPQQQPSFLQDPSGAMNGLLSNPAFLGGLGYFAGQGSLPASRLPYGKTASLAAGVQGLIGGIDAGNAAQKSQAETQLLQQEYQQKQLANQMALARFQYMAARHPEMFPQGLLGKTSATGTASAGGGGSSPLLGTSSASPSSYGPTSQFGVAQAPSSGPTPAGDSPQSSASAPALLGNSSGSLFSPQQESQIMDAQFLGLPSEVIAKQFPGPSDLARLTAERDAIAAKNPQDQRLPLYDFAMRNAAGAKPVPVRAGTDLTDPLTGQLIFRNPNLSPDMQYDAATGTVQAIPGATSALAALTAAKAGAEQGAIGAREKNVKGFENYLSFGGLGMGTPSGAIGGAPAGARAFGIPITGALPSPRSSIVGALPPPPLGATPPDIGGAAAAASQRNAPFPAASADPTAPVQTTIPPVSQQAPIPKGAAYLDKRLPQWAETENEWSKALPSNLQAEQRALAIADALKKTESGAWATDKASVAAGLKAVGIDLPPNILGDPAQVQIALKDNFASTLATIRAFTSRPAAAEVILGQKNFSNPDLQPAANLKIIAQTVGQMRWERALMNDWAQAKTQGWQDPQDFQRAWSKANPLQKFMDQTEAEIGPLKGMAGASPQASGSGAQPKLAPYPPMESRKKGVTTWTAPSGQKYLWNGMAWDETR